MTGEMNVAVDRGSRSGSMGVAEALPIEDIGITAAGPVVLVVDQASLSGFDRLLLDEVQAACGRAGRSVVVVTDRAGAAQVRGSIAVDLAAPGDVAPERVLPTWCVRVAGRPPGGRWGLSAAWHRPPYWSAVEICRVDGASVAAGIPADVMARAIIGTTGEFAALQHKVARTAALLLERALAPASGIAAEAAVLGEVEETGSGPGVADGAWALGQGWARRQVARWRDRLTAEWWTVGVVDRSIGTIMSEGRLGPVVWLRPKSGRAYWADPFAWPSAGADRSDLAGILCEECPIDGGPGVIASLRLGGDGHWRRDRVLIGDDVHRSYPSTFVDGQAVYLLPECIDGGAAVLYRLDARGGLETVATIAAGAWADATLFRWGDRFWAAATDLRIGPHDNLCLFHAESLTGPWRPHRRNPVKLDVRSSRSAGTPFWHDGELFRPAQDCAAAYGAAVVVNRVTTLTESQFHETPALRLAPDSAGAMPDGLHTLSTAGDRVLVDGKRLVASPGLALRRAARRVRASGRGHA